MSRNSRVTQLCAILLTWCGSNIAFADGPVDYEKQVKVILKERCFACHGALKQESGLRLDTGQLIREGGDSGAAVVAKNPQESLLIERVSSEDEVERMPPEGESLTAEQIETLKLWIAQGAVSPKNEQPEADPRDHWAFRPPRRPAVPKVAAKDIANPIDAFVARKLAEHELNLVEAAPKHVLLRRVYLNLVGIPPTREELNAFLADKSPDAYERVVDRLLKSPRHGERWARHWMDVWRYSDWYGRRHVPDVWNSAPQVWRWRDWIVRSLNEDKGYDRMLQEMLAADEICPEDADAAVATGYLIRNWYALNPNDWMRNTVEHTGKAFLGLTFNCAHCHDHKYDPITQDKYFQLRAYFEPMYIRQDRVPGEADPGTFQDYEYSVLRKIQRLGAVRVFDKAPEAPTWFYTGGDERNRDKERGSMPPGVPEFLTETQPKIEAIDLPPRAFYPGLSPAIQESVVADARSVISAAESKLAEVDKMPSEVPASAQEQLAGAQAAYNAALEKSNEKARSAAISGNQSLVFDATQGRRIVLNRLAELKALPDGISIEFQLLLAADAHFNFQLVKDVDKGLTASMVAFEQGRIVSYQPGTTTEFDVGRYDFAAGQNRFQVRLVLQTGQDRCRLTVRCLSDEAVLVDSVEVALNGWNPVGDQTKAVTFDARTGSAAAVDELVLRSPAGKTSAGVASLEVLTHFDFEPPVYPEGRDVIGLGGWEGSRFSTAPATSRLAATFGDSLLLGLKQQLETAQRVARIPDLRHKSAESRLAAARAELASVEARIAADRAKFEESDNAQATELAAAAALAVQSASLHQKEAEQSAAELALAIAEAKPADAPKRAKELESARKQWKASGLALEKARAAKVDESAAEYSPLSPMYPNTSTGRRRALAQWITRDDNPLTARVAVNHIWMRHFHAPIVTSMYDFGRNGSRPTHAELLDWLAVELMESGWSMKHIHRLIVTSQTYRRATTVGGESGNAAADPENKFLWRMNSGRMEAEVVRDSLLYCGGMLDLKTGGPPLENKDALTTYRRSLYYEVYPEDGGASELSALFDPPDPLDCYRRTRSIVPQQALALTNSDLVHQVGAKIVVSWGKSDQADSSDAQFVTAMFQRILSRKPTEEEHQLCLDALKQQVEILSGSGSKDPHVGGRESIVRALLNHNDFVTIR